MKHIRQANRQDKKQIEVLRINEFQRSAQFTLLKPEKLFWNRNDDSAVVLAAWDGPRAVATMRAVIVDNPKEAQDCVQCIVPEDTNFPAMVFSNAATHWDYRGMGLNQLLRFYFLQIALDNEIQSLLSPMYESAPRIRFMVELGYQFAVPKQSWQDKLKAKTTRILGVLARPRMPRALDYIRTKRPEIIKAYPWQSPRVALEVQSSGFKVQISGKKAVG